MFIHKSLLLRTCAFEYDIIEHALWKRTYALPIVAREKKEYHRGNEIFPNEMNSQTQENLQTTDWTGLHPALSKVIYFIIALLLTVAVTGVVLYVKERMMLNAVNQAASPIVNKGPVPGQKTPTTIFGIVKKVDRTNNTITVEAWLEEEDESGNDHYLVTGTVNSSTRFTRFEEQNGMRTQVPASFSDLAEGKGVSINPKDAPDKSESADLVFLSVQILN